MRQDLGELLRQARTGAEVSQTALAAMFGRTRHLVSKVESGERRLAPATWTVVDDACRAGGKLAAAAADLDCAEHDYAERCKAADRRPRRTGQEERPGSGASRSIVPAPVLHLLTVSDEDRALTAGGLAEELIQVVAKLVAKLGRRNAIKVATLAITALTLSGDDDDMPRMAAAVESPSRVDPQVIATMSATLAHAKRQEDKLGPLEVIETVAAQHWLASRLLDGCPDEYRPALQGTDAAILAALGGYFIDLGDHASARRCLRKARKAAHEAGSRVIAAYVLASLTFSFFLTGNTHDAIDAAAAAKNVAAGIRDRRVRAFAEQMSAAADALRGDFRHCTASMTRAQRLITSADTSESLAYWITPNVLNSQGSVFLLALRRPQPALEIAREALAGFDRRYVGLHAFCEVRYATALAASREAEEAARILTTVTTSGELSPRLIGDIRAARAALGWCQETPHIRALDAQLAERGLAQPLRYTSA